MTSLKRSKRSKITNNDKTPRVKNLTNIRQNTGISYQPHQDVTLRYIQKHPSIFGMLIAHTMGSGKCVVGLSIAEMFPSLKLVVIGPKVLEFVWKEECEKHKFSRCNFKFIPDTHHASILDQNFKGCIVIVDEAHRLKQMAEKSPKCYRHLNTGSKLFLMTGTPIYDDESDLAFLINLLAKKEVLPRSVETFRSDFMKVSVFKSAWVGYWRQLLKTFVNDPFLSAGTTYAAQRLGFKYLLQAVTSTVLSRSSSYLAWFKAGHFLAPLQLFSLYTIATGWILGDSKWSLRHVDKPKLQNALRGYVSYYKAPVGNIKVKEHRVNCVYTMYQLTFFIRFLNDNLNIDELHSLIKNNNNVTNKENINLKLAKIYTTLHSSLYSGIKIGNFASGEQIPTKFIEILKRSDYGSIRSIVYSNFTEAGIKRFSSFLTDTKHKHVLLTSSDTPQQSRDKLGIFNRGECNFLLLAPDFTEGISTKGVRQVHIMEPIVVYSKRAQVIARAIRFDSHQHLPTNERSVDVYEYVAICGNALNFDKYKEPIERWLKGEKEYFPGLAPIKRNYNEYKTILQHNKLLSPDELIMTRQQNVNQNVKDIVDVFSSISP